LAATVLVKVERSELDDVERSELDDVERCTSAATELVNVVNSCSASTHNFPIKETQPRYNELKGVLLNATLPPEWVYLNTGKEITIVTLSKNCGIIQCKLTVLENWEVQLCVHNKLLAPGHDSRGLRYVTGIFLPNRTVQTAFDQLIKMLQGFKRFHICCGSPHNRYVARSVRYAPLLAVWCCEEETI